MSASQLARRLGLTQQAVNDLEQREKRGTITLETLQRAAEALECDLVYAIVPRAELSVMRSAQARKQAARRLDRVAHSMYLEAQGVPPAEHEQQVAEEADRLLRTWSRRLWEVEES
jgi:predicted DNA-binding mobile mystery protein A